MMMMMTSYLVSRAVRRGIIISRSRSLLPPCLSIISQRLLETGPETNPNTIVFTAHYPRFHCAAAGVGGGLNFAAFSSSSTFVRGVSTDSSKEKDEEENRENDGRRRKGGGEQMVASWVDLYLPSGACPYAHLARLDKPIGTWLLAWPCFWSITLAATPGHLPDFKMMALFGCGALLLRGAGCTINDLLDRDIDTKVERTKLRPIASGLLTPFKGLCFLGFQLLLGLGILLQLNDYSRILGASSLFLVFSYPLMKRITFWPQAYLGLTFNWGALLGWSAVKGSLDPSIVLPLYLGGVFWTLVYDTIYAHQDKEDDLKVGVKSTALRFGNSTREWTTGFGIACIGSLALTGSNADIGWPFYPFLAAASGQLAWQIWTVNMSCRADCNRMFVSNKWFGALIFSGIFFGRLWSYGNAMDGLFLSRRDTLQRQRALQIMVQVGFAMIDKTQATSSKLKRSHVQYLQFV